MSSQTPPKHLSLAARQWWKKLCAEYALDDAAAQIILASALSSFDHWQEAQRIVDKEGIVTRDRFGQKRSHPALTILKDSKAAMLAALAALRLDVEPLRDSVGRPPGSSRPLEK